MHRVLYMPLVAVGAQKTKALTDVRRFYRLCKHCHGAPRSRRSIHRHMKMALRSLLVAPWSFQWFEFLELNPLANAFLQSNPRLAEKSYRDYLRNTLNPQQRVETLQTHYRILQQHF